MCRLLSVIAAGLLALAAGCSASSEASQATSAAGSKQFLLAEEPESPVGILEFRETQAEIGSGAAAELVLFGRVGGGKQVFSEGSAEFVISDPTHTPAAEAHACTSDNCPFCKHKHDDSSATAIVMLTDEQGRVPTVAARSLLPLDEGQLIVVRGAAEINAIGQLVVKARGVYIRQ